MAGKGKTPGRNTRLKTLRGKVWRGMRIMRKFTVRAVLSTSGMETDERDYKCIGNWFAQLSRHGYVRRLGGPPFVLGQSQAFALSKDTVVMPIVCDVCGNLT